MAAPQFKAVLIATPQMRSESGLIFRSKQSAVWPADPRGRRGGCEPAGKTCYLPRFHIMHRPAVLPVEDRRSCGENARRQTDPCADFVCLELPRGRTLGRNQNVELEIKKAKVNGTASKLPAAQRPCDKTAEAIVMDGGKRGQTVEVCADPRLPRPSFRHTHIAAGRRVAQDFRMPTPRSMWVPFAFFAGAGTTDAWYGVSGMTMANP
jgi:hypothetical protein